MGILVKLSGSFDHTEKFLNWAKKEIEFPHKLQKLGKEGVEALAAATPKHTGLTADSWEYEVERDANGVTFNWYNTNDQNGEFNVAIGLQYGHGTGGGGYVHGVDYINPALKPVFDKIAEEIWQEIQSK